MCVVRRVAYAQTATHELHRHETYRQVPLMSNPLKENSMNLANILAFSRTNRSRSWIPAMTNMQLSAVFGEKPSRNEVLARMNNRQRSGSSASI